MRWRLVSRNRKGEYVLHLSADERDLLRTIPAELRALLATDDPVLRRLFPPAHANDDARNEEYARLTKGDLLSKKLAAMDALEATADEERLSEEQILMWLGALNDTRLVLGTMLDVAEDMDDEPFPDDDPRAHTWAIYRYLSALVDEIVQAVSGS